jgi:hypothetical protein
MNLKTTFTAFKVRLLTAIYILFHPKTSWAFIHSDLRLNNFIYGNYEEEELTIKTHRLGKLKLSLFLITLLEDEKMQQNVDILTTLHENHNKPIDDLVNEFMNDLMESMEKYDSDKINTTPDAKAPCADNLIKDLKESTAMDELDREDDAEKEAAMEYPMTEDEVFPTKKVDPVPVSDQKVK